MNKQATFLLLSFFALLCMNTPSLGAPSRRGADKPKQHAGTLHNLTIFFSNDVRGETEPCG